MADETSYSAGSLDLEIIGVSESAVASIDRAVKSLNALSRSVNKINSTQFVFAGDKLEVLFTKIAKATNSINTRNLTALASVATSISGISKISKISQLSKIDWNSISQGFGNLTIAITPFVNKVKEAEASLTALYGILKRTSGKDTGSIINKGTSSSFSFGKFFKLSVALNVLKTSINAIINGARKLGNILANIVIKGADFGETINLWTVSMTREFLPQATKFVNKLNEAYGISKQTLMNSQAIFKNMLGSLGQISDETAYKLSEGITQMALDYASLYNVKFEDAMTKFQAALAGQVRPIRSVSGYDITENTLYQLYQELGGSKTMRQLSRTEKQLLAIYAVFQQMAKSGATGDLERTINSFANQSRITKDAWNDVQTYAGLTVARILEQFNVMKYINAALIFMSRILEGLATSLDTGLGNSGDVFVDMENSINDTTEAADKLQKSLLDFDQFRALDQQNEIENPLDLDQTILDAMSKYESILDKAESESRKLADNWLKILGFTDENSDGIIDISDGISGFEKKLHEIDWSTISENIIEQFDIAFEHFQISVDSLSFKEWGIDFAEFLNGIDVNAIYNWGYSLIKGLLQGILEFIYGTLTNIDFLHAIGSIIVFVLRSTILSSLSLIVTAVDAIGTFAIAVLDDIYNYFKDTILLKAFTEALVSISILIGTSLNIIKNIFIEFFEFLVENFKRLGEIVFNIITAPFTLPIKFGKTLADVFNVEFFANGGLPDKGSMFIAGEAGAEFVYNMPNGQSGVANIQQIAQATYQGTTSALRDWWGGMQAKGDIPQLREASPTGMYQAVTGVAKSYGEKWSNY